MAWNPEHHPAVFVKLAPGGLAVSLVRHDGYPYEEDWNEDAAGWDGLFDIANRYLALVNTRLKLPQAWLDDLSGGSPGGGRPPGLLRWLRNQDDPRHSYWVRRQSGLDDSSRPETGSTLDRSAVLLASLSLPFGEALQPWILYGGQGLRIILQTGPPQAGVQKVRITGVTSTLPPPKTSRIGSETLSALSALIKLVFGLAENVGVVDVGIRLPEESEAPIIFAKTAPPEGYPSDDYSYNGTSYQLVMRVNLNVRGGLEPIAQRPLIAFADADVFVQDPVSKFGAADFTKYRPSRSWRVLDDGRAHVQLGNLPAGGGGRVELVDPDPNNQPNFQVLNCRLVDQPQSQYPETSPKEVPPSTTEHVRTNTFAAINAFYRTGTLFDLMRTYGLSPVDYFRFVTLPIDVRYRAGIFPGAGDGRTVNAQVRWTLEPDASPTGEIEVRFALGDLNSAVGRLPANFPSAVEKSPLVVATDPRWCWHEYCHVLLTAAVGELELRFAHSAGDALAAILSDPESKLAYDRAGALANDGPWRGVTFPWVLIPRRHDRSVYDGWGWTGPLNRRELFFAVPGLLDKRGYWGEQILSSSLFRLYRAIGGDSEDRSSGPPAPAKAARKNAADYVVYLIMRAIQSLGAASVTPSTTPDVFVDVMRKADTATATAPGPGGYVGGTVHKVVQWAFERQGLYGVPIPESAVGGPEELATIDLHIDDLRPKPDGPYSPVDLLGQAWHARPTSLWVRRSYWPCPFGNKHKIGVRVENRGADPADHARVEVWWAPVVGGAIPAFPDSSTWKSLGTQTHRVPRRTGQTTGVKEFGPFNWTPPAPQDYAILATATHPGDPSNVDPTTGLSCASIASPVNLLVACDNNLGLIIVTIT